jgi:hypothetical protein
MLATGVHSLRSVCQLFSFIFHVIFKLHQPIHEAQIYFVFLSVGNPKTVLKGGYSGWIGGSSFASPWLERWLVWACKCAYACGMASYINGSLLKADIKQNSFSAYGPHDLYLLSLLRYGHICNIREVRYTLRQRLYAWVYHDQL